MVLSRRRQRLEGEAVADREQVGGHRLRVVAQVQYPFGLLGSEDLADMAPCALEKLAQLALDVGISAAGAEQLKQQQDMLLDSCRGYVRERPLVVLGVALAAGYLFGRLTR